ncbi:MAG: InlB B-repeat-containing protein [Oscillospiraceae bacterium]|nr:InlB B-repeat-containing protein [Oscillospiraceae bacterium]
MFKKLLGLLLALLLVLGTVGTAGVAFATGTETDPPGEETTQPGEEPEPEPEPEPSVYTVTFESNGGSAVDAQSVTENETADRPTDPEREGFTFDGWFADADLSEPFDFSAPVTADITVYAGWTENALPVPETVTVIFDSDGGSDVPSQTVTSGETIVRPDDPTREGYRFLGWSLDDAPFDFSTPIESNLILTALWEEEIVIPEPQTFTVIFEVNGGSAVAQQTVTENETAVRPTDPVRAGYTFSGWFSDAGLINPFDFSAPVTADAIAFAKWTQNSPPPATKVDTRLNWLEIECGQLHPAFSPDIYSYTVYVTPEQENRSCRVLCDTFSSDAHVDAEGPQTVGKSDVVRKLTVSGGGRRAEYTIIVHVITPQEMLLDGEFYSITDRPATSGLPGTFTVGQITMNGEKISAAQSTDGQMLLVQFTSQTEGAEPLWYRYEESTKRLYPASVVEINREKYILVDQGNSLLYGSEAGVGTFYVYNQETKEWVYQTKDYDELTVQPIPTVIEKEFPGWPLTITLGVWSLAASAAVFLLYRRSKQQKKKSVYFRPYFSAEDSEEKTAEGDRS